MHARKHFPPLLCNMLYHLLCFHLLLRALLAMRRNHILNINNCTFDSNAAGMLGSSSSMGYGGALAMNNSRWVGKWGSSSMGYGLGTGAPWP